LAVTITIIITTMDSRSRSYTQETPAWLWKAWTDGGPGARADRYC